MSADNGNVSGGTSAGGSSGAGVQRKPKVYIIFYSMYGHVYELAKAVAQGVVEGGGEVCMYRVPETLDAATLKKMNATTIAEDVPVITMDKLAEADAILFGIPSRFGMACAQMKALLDQTGSLWQKKALVGKPASVFFSSATQNGGQESVALTWYTQLVHHGMIILPIGYACPNLFDMTEIHGGSAYGAGTIAGPDGSRFPSKLELGTAQYQGRYVAQTTVQLLRGRSLSKLSQ